MAEAAAKKAEDLEFKWGELKGTGGKNRDVKFYKSFRFDGEDYDLYDCVYLYKDGEAEPEIGKIIKIWETPQKTGKVKILWFFRPCEITKFLGDENILENELFLASGPGRGVHNLNPVGVLISELDHSNQEAIAGKCSILCIYKDKENPQPSDEELQKADFVFHRTFDVVQQKIMDKIEGKIADVDVKFLFNKINIQKPAVDLNVDLGENTSKLNSFKEPNNVVTPTSSVDKHILSVEKQKSAIGLDSGEMDQTNDRRQVVSSSKGKGKEEEANNNNVLPKRLDVKEPTSTKDRIDSVNEPTKRVTVDGNEPGDTEVERNLNGKSNPTPIMPEKLDANTSRNGAHKHKVNANGSYMKDLSLVASLVDERGNLEGLEDSVGTNKCSTYKLNPNVDPSTHSNNKSPKSSYRYDENKVQSALSPSRSVDNDKDKCKDEEESLIMNNDSKKKMMNGETLVGNNDSKQEATVGESPVGNKNSKKRMKVGESSTGDKGTKKMKIGERATNISLEGDQDFKKIKVGDQDYKKKINVGDKTPSVSTGKPPKPSLRLPQNVAKKNDGRVLEVMQRADANDIDGNDKNASSPIDGNGFGKHKSPVEKMKSVGKAPRLSDGAMGEKSTTQSHNKFGKSGGQVTEVTQRPDADRRKWFKNFPWQDRMQAADEEGTLILLQNLDPAYTSAEVEDIVWNGLGESCTAHMIQQTKTFSTYYGQALVIFKKREIAKKVVRKLDEGCLLLSNGRPLIGSFATTCSREKKPRFFGHIVIDKLRQPMINEREMREAVATSHFSQPNTIEYDMAMEWCLQQEKTDALWKRLYKQQWKEVNELKAKLKTK